MKSLWRFSINVILLSVIYLLYSCTGGEVLEISSTEKQYGSGFDSIEGSESLNTATHLQNVFRNIAKVASPSVVTIKVEKKHSAQAYNPFDFFFKFDKNYGKGRNKKNPIMIGSGFIISKEGYIVTNYHVIKDYENILVYDKGKKEYKAEVVGHDSVTDLAVLKINKGHNIKALFIGDSSSIEIGDMVIAIGNPFNLNSTFTFGVVSATGRKDNLIDRNAIFKNFIQTDTPINHGNSGGPLLNIKGEVIGVNTAIYSTGIISGFIGIGFAIPANISKDIIKKLITKGKVVRGYIGVRISNMTKDLIKYHKIKEGVFVNDVDPDGPSLRAGVKDGDIITAVNKNKIKNVNELINIISAYPPKTKVVLDIVRGTKKIKITVTLVERKARPFALK